MRNEFTGLDQDEADRIAQAAYERKDYITLTKLEVADEPLQEGLPGFGYKVTLGAKDQR